MVLPRTSEEAGRDWPLAAWMWCRRDPKVAAQLLEGCLAAGRGGGEGGEEMTLLFPAVCQLAEQVSKRLPEGEGTEFLLRMIRGWGEGAEAWMDGYDREGRGLAVWPSAEQALFPAVWGKGRVSAELLVLLSNEISVVERHGVNAGVPARILDLLEGYRRELDEWLTGAFWNAETTEVQRYEPGQGLVADESPCGMFLLAWTGLRPEMTDAIRSRAPQGTGWTVRGWLWFLALMMDSPHRQVVARMLAEGIPAGATEREAVLGEAMVSWGRAQRTPLPRWMGRMEGSAADAGKGGTTFQANGRRGKRRVRWGGLLCVAAVAAAVGLAGVGASIGSLWREGANHDSELLLARGTPLEVERRARQLEEDGHPAEAAMLYADLVARGGDDARYYVYRLAVARMAEGDWAAAEALCNRLLAVDSSSPNVRMNRALCVLQGGRRAEALGAYRALAEDEQMREQFTDIAARAQLAVTLLEGQMRLDGEDIQATLDEAVLPDYGASGMSSGLE